MRDKILGMIEDYARSLEHQPSFKEAYESLVVSLRPSQDIQSSTKINKPLVIKSVHATGAPCDPVQALLRHCLPSTPDITIARPFWTLLACLALITKPSNRPPNWASKVCMCASHPPSHKHTLTYALSVSPVLCTCM